MTLLRVRATLSGWSGGPGLSTFYFTPGTAGGSTADATDVCARVRAFFNAVSARLPGAVSVNVSPIADAFDEATGILTGSFSSSAPPTAVTGTGAGEFYAPQVYALLQMNTATVIGGRRVQGRSFFGPLHEADVSSGTYSTAARSSVEGSALLQLSAGVFPTLSSPKVWHRPKNGAGGAAVIITSYSCPAKLATLKSRRDN